MIENTPSVGEVDSQARAILGPYFTNWYHQHLVPCSINPPYDDLWIDVEVSGLSASGKTTASGFIRRLHQMNPVINSLVKPAFRYYFSEFGRFRDFAEELKIIKSKSGFLDRDEYARLAVLQSETEELGRKYLPRPALMLKEKVLPTGWIDRDGSVVSIPRGDLHAARRVAQESLAYFNGSSPVRREAFSLILATPEEFRLEIFKDRETVQAFLSGKVGDFDDPALYSELQGILKIMDIYDNRHPKAIYDSYRRDASRESKERQDRAQNEALVAWIYQEKNDPDLIERVKSPGFFILPTEENFDLMYEYYNWWISRTLYDVDLPLLPWEDQQYIEGRNKVLKVSPFAGMVFQHRRQLDQDDLIKHLRRLARNSAAVKTELNGLKARVLELAA